MANNFSFASRPEGFDNHISKSIRGYNDLIDDVINISQYFIEDYSYVYDIGCSTGKMLKAMIDANNKFAPHALYRGIEFESKFFETYDDDELKYTNLKYERDDVRRVHFHYSKTSLATSIFTLQFMSWNDRVELIKRIYDSLTPNGAFVFAEKTISDVSRIHEIRTFTYYDYKRKSFEYEDIMQKERELRHMLKPNTNSELVKMCFDAGFGGIDTFWQNHSFVGYIALKNV